MGGVLAAILLAGLLAPTSAAVAPGCPAGRPTRVGGTIRGSDGRVVNTAIGITFRDQTRSVMADGSPNTSGGYAAIWQLNTSHPPTGLATGTIDWSICVVRAVILTHAEAYPKRPLADGDANGDGLPDTDESRYGSTAYYRQPVTPGGTTSIGLRLPVTWQAARGNTGGVHGYVWWQGRRVPPSAITRVRAFTYQSGADCGIEGLSASADQLLAGVGGTYYRVDYLAAGQCGRSRQVYSLQMDCTGFCGTAKRSFAMRVGIVRGQRPRVDVSF